MSPQDNNVEAAGYKSIPNPVIIWVFISKVVDKICLGKETHTDTADHHFDWVLFGWQDEANGPNFEEKENIDDNTLVPGFVVKENQCPGEYQLLQQREGQIGLKNGQGLYSVLFFLF